jgi:hypothetical protein
MNVVCYKQVIDFMNLVSHAANMVNFFSTFLGGLVVLLGSLSEVDSIVQGKLHKVVFLLGHIHVVITTNESLYIEYIH